MKEISRLFAYTVGLRKYIIFIASASILIALVGMAAPFIIKFATDEVVAMVSGDLVFENSTLPVLIGLLCLSYAMVALIHGVNGYVGDMLAARMRKQLSEAYYTHLLALPQQYYDEETTGKVINRLNRAIADVIRFVNVFSNNLLQMLLTVTVSIGVMFWYSWEIALVVAVQIPIYIYLTASTSKKWQRYEKHKNEHLDISSGRFAEVVGQMRLVKSFRSEKREFNKFTKHYDEVVDTTNSQSRYWHTMDVIRSMVRVLVYTIVFAVLFYRTSQGEYSIGDMVLLVTLLQQTSMPLQNMSFFVDLYQRAVANSRDYAEVMSEKPEEVVAGGRSLKVEKGRVEYQDVSFAYNDKETVLEDISFTIRPGQKLALVGESGGGKTTISNLLMRLYRPQEGKILIDDVDINTVSVKSLRDSIATVFQDATLFSGTIRENIAYGRPGATQEELESAARSANALKFIESLEKGFDTEIGERGIKLSGGQKQRISIARAILKDAPILILDEATSSLDSRAEHEVQKALDRLMKGRTTLIIAHRLSTIADVDTIVTLKNGTIDEIGSPAKLAKTDGIYAQLLKLQTVTSESAREKLASFDIKH